ncbi:MAG: beta-ketoacyl synthase N-terminal-like domain-containing protein [Buchnera aphidicola (Kaburagia rhusicola rhusicola)]
MKRVVITGLGIISSIGNNKQEVLNSLLYTKSGISFSEEMKQFGMRSHVCGNVKLDVSQCISRKTMRFMNNASIYSYLSMKEAIKDANLTTEMYQNNSRVGVIVGSSSGSPKCQVNGVNAIKKRGLKSISPYVVIQSMTSNISACLGTAFKIYGINYSISSACSSSAHCIGNAIELIQLGKQDVIFAGGGEEISQELACTFDAMGALSTNYNSDPTASSRVFDFYRDGFVISGGAGIVVIEELNYALSRSARIYAEIIGYGTSSDGFNMVIPSGDGAIRCMNLATKTIDKSSIDYLNAHGTSTKIGDLVELNAIRKVFSSTNIPIVSSTKSITGHALGASGVQEIIYSLLMLEHSFLVPSINIIRLDPVAKNCNILTVILKKQVSVIMSNSFGFGGTNVSLVIKKFY